MSFPGPDEFFGLLMPPPNQPFSSPEDFAATPIEGLNIRAAVAAMPPEVRPNLRWYTVRHLDKARGLLAFDVATHGVSAEDVHSTSGPGLSWCLSAQPGDPAGLWTCQGLWHREHRTQLLVADPTSLLSMRAILEYLATLYPEQLASTHVIAVTSTDSDSEPHLEDWRNRLSSLTRISAPSDGYAQAIAEHLANIDVESSRNRQHKPPQTWTMCGSPGRGISARWCAPTPSRLGSSTRTTSCGALIGSSARLAPSVHPLSP